jgi:hypothetical protein
VDRAAWAVRLGVGLVVLAWACSAQAQGVALRPTETLLGQASSSSTTSPPASTTASPSTASVATALASPTPQPTTVRPSASWAYPPCHCSPTLVPDVTAEAAGEAPTAASTVGATTPKALPAPAASILLVVALAGAAWAASDAKRGR